MRYVSIDIETTGLDSETCQIIEFAAVVDDLTVQKPIGELPFFQTFIRHHTYKGEPYALAMHQKIFQRIANHKKEPCNLIWPEDLFHEFFRFLVEKGGYNQSEHCTGDLCRSVVKVNVAGKNFANFDRRFLEKLPNRDSVIFHHRTIDPAMLYFDSAQDKEVPSTELCMKRAGINGPVAHTALEDAYTVIKLIRHKFPLS